MLYGQKPRHFGLSVDNVEVPGLSDWLHERQLMNALVKQHLLRSKQRMKKQADMKRSERQFQVGDMVFLKLQPYVQSSIAARSCNKLAFKFFGPFRVLARVGSVAYKLQLPESSSVHPIFHVSQLKMVVGAGHSASPSLPDDNIQWSIPERVLQRRLLQKGLRSVSQVLVKWSLVPEALSTWEDLEALKQQFPHAPAWGQVASQGGENVSTTDGPASMAGPRRGVRARKPSGRVTGPEWVQAFADASLASAV